MSDIRTIANGTFDEVFPALAAFAHEWVRRHQVALRARVAAERGSAEAAGYDAAELAADIAHPQPALSLRIEGGASLDADALFHGALAGELAPVEGLSPESVVRLLRTVQVVLADALALEFLANTGFGSEDLARGVEREIEAAQTGRPAVIDGTPDVADPLDTALAWLSGTLDRWGLDDDLVDASMERFGPWFVAAFPRIALSEARDRERAAREDADRERAARQAAEQAAERALARRQRGDRTLFPQAIQGGWRDKDHAERAARIERGDLVPADDETRELVADAAITARHSREFADLTVPQIRALFAVMSLATDSGEVDEGGRFRKELEVSARALYEEAGINHRQPKLCKDLVRAVLDLADRRTWLDVTMHDKETGKLRTRTVEGPIFKVDPLWDDVDPERLNRWAAWRQSHQRTPWSGALPPAYAISLSPLARLLVNPFAISRDTLKRLEQGAKAVRGGKLTALDWALFMEMAFTRQSQQIEVLAIDGAPEVTSVRCYVDRRKFMEGYFGKAELQRNPKRCTEAYQSSARVLLEGQLALSMTPDQTSKRGARDVFVANPEVILGVGPRAERAREVQAAKQRRRLAGAVAADAATEPTSNALDSSTADTARPARRRRRG